MVFLTLWVWLICSYQTFSHSPFSKIWSIICLNSSPSTSSPFTYMLHMLMHVEPMTPITFSLLSKEHLYPISLHSIFKPFPLHSSVEAGISHTLSQWSYCIQCWVPEGSKANDWVSKNQNYEEICISCSTWEKAKGNLHQISETGLLLSGLHIYCGNDKA